MEEASGGTRTHNTTMPPVDSVRLLDLSPHGITAQDCRHLREYVLMPLYGLHYVPLLSTEGFTLRWQSFYYWSQTRLHITTIVSTQSLVPQYYPTPPIVYSVSSMHPVDHESVKSALSTLTLSSWKGSPRLSASFEGGTSSAWFHYHTAFCDSCALCPVPAAYN